MLPSNKPTLWLQGLNCHVTECATTADWSKDRRGPVVAQHFLNHLVSPMCLAPFHSRHTVMLTECHTMLSSLSLCWWRACPSQQIRLQWGRACPFSFAYSAHTHTHCPVDIRANGGMKWGLWQGSPLRCQAAKCSKCHFISSYRTQVVLEANSFHWIWWWALKFL